MKKKYLILGIFLLLGFLIFNKTLSELKPIPKVTFKSQNLNYDKKEPGSFKVEKSAKWIGEGKAKVTIDVDSVLKEKAKAKDIVFVVDASSTMYKDRIIQVKKDMTEMGSAFLANSNNRIALIAFRSDAERLLDFTNNKEMFLEKVNNLKLSGTTNYKAGFDEAYKLLNNYKKEKERDLLLLFITGSFSKKDSPNERSSYNELKAKHPYMPINLVQYQIGRDIKWQFTMISDAQFATEKNDLNNILFEAGTNSISYDNFIITDDISKNFNGNISSLKTNQGKAKLDGKRLLWNLGDYKSGQKARLEIELEQINTKEEFYKISNNISIETKFEQKGDKQKSNNTPILKGFYKLIFDGNAPQGCTVKGLNENTSYRPYAQVSIDIDNPTCEGYLFNGYKIDSKVKYLNGNYFGMPESDVVLKATWTKIKINKKMSGTIGRRNIYEEIKSSSLGNDKLLGINYKNANSNKNGEGIYLFDETKNDAYPVYFFRGTHNLKNNLLYGGFCWKIIRTTETGGIRIIYNGTPVNGKCNTKTGQETSIGNTKYNLNNNRKKYAGYMYGSDSNPYENINDSNVKEFLDKWYKNNIKVKNLDNKLDKKAIYCGDRTEGPEEWSWMKYKVLERIEKSKPSLSCPINDSYSVDAGNKKLTYPVGLLTSDEAKIAGLINYSTSNNNFYLYTNSWYWVMSPSGWGTNWGYSGMLGIASDGKLGYVSSSDIGGVRPVLTLKGTLAILNGDGSQNNPYII